MHSYARTNVQLLNQLRRDGYSSTELGCIRDAYELAMVLFTGQYQPSGRTLIDHVVGTASILGALHATVEVVAAGLIHAAYDYGDFGGRRKGISEAKRKQVRHAVGGQVEEYVARYTALHWDVQTSLSIRDNVATLDRIDRDVVLMRLANHLELLLDLSLLYTSSEGGAQKYIDRFFPPMVDIAYKLGYPTLAAEISQRCSENTSNNIPMELRRTNGPRHVYLIAPKSYRRPFSMAFHQELSSGVHRLRSEIRVRTRLRQLVSGLRRFIVYRTAPGSQNHPYE